jgi:glycosyltransferase involved in cell wall biosynthesis
VKILLFANTDWYLFNFRLSLAQALRADGHNIVLVSPPGKYSARLQAAGFRWIEFPLSRRGTNPLFEMITVARLRRLYRQEKPDFAHHFTIKCVLYGSLAARLAGVKRIINAITGLGYVFIGTKPRASALLFMVKSLYRLALHNTRVIFQNVDDRALFLEMGLVNLAQSSLIEGSGVDTQRFTPTPEPEGIPLVVLPARLLWDKGVGEFVEAARLLRAEGIPARFALIGDTDPDNPAGVSEPRLHDWQAEGVVECWGWQEDMSSVYERANIVCLPSYREGLPRTLVEAAACGRALVASDVPGCRGIVRNAENGLLVPARDGQALAAALKTVLLDPALRQEMGKLGRAMVEAGFSVEKVVSETLQVYRGLGLAQGAPA